MMRCGDYGGLLRWSFVRGAQFNVGFFFFSFCERCTIETPTNHGPISGELARLNFATTRCHNPEYANEINNDKQHSHFTISKVGGKSLGSAAVANAHPSGGH